jgi:beta-glucosidase-like glycosyl hydrolase/CubicO group peptidase (beta-lactamase class C family)
MKKLSFLLVLSIFFNLIAIAQKSPKEIWVDSVYQHLSTQEKLGQLLMLRANQSHKAYNKNIDQYIKDYNIGGICFFASGPLQQVHQTNKWQAKAKTPLLISIDAEWGLGMRLDSTISYPFQLTLGSISNDSLIYEMGYQIGKECRRMGIHLNFAPVVDVNNNPNNPVINSRSFGDKPAMVAKKAAMYMKGLQEAGVLATAKHFPGHGDTSSDSHKTLPTVAHNKKRLDSIELFPYRQLIKQGLSGVMVAHLYVPAYESTKHLATTLSPKVVNGLLRKKLGFDGLIVTDALDMKGVTKYFPSGEIEVRALLAGSDILLLPENVPQAINGLMKAYKSGRIPDDVLENRCKKILSYKYDLGLTTIQNTNPDRLISSLNSAKGKALREKLFEEAITLVENHNEILPLRKMKKQELAIVSFGLKPNSSFEKYASKYTDATYLYLPKTLSIAQNDSILQLLKSFDRVIFNIGRTTIFPQRSFGITSSSIELIKKASKQNSCIINLLGSPLAMQKYFKNPKLYDAFILSHQDNRTTEKLSAEMIFGALGFHGVLPVDVSKDYQAGFGIETKALGKLSYGSAENQQINSDILKKNIDSIVIAGIKMHAFPGCQICVARNGSVIFEKNYGYQTYDSIIPVNENSIYDIASVTKVSASIPVLMRLYEDHKLDLDAPIVDYLPYLEGSNKADLHFRDILTHQARLTAWIPFYWYNTDSSGRLNPEVFQYFQNDIFSVRVAENLYINKNYHYQMYDTIAKSKLRKKKEYKYSDLGYYWIPKLVDKYFNVSMDKYVMEHFYEPLNMKRTAYLPREHFNLKDIVPTEDDTLFRKQVIHGDVHDPGAAMLGGISGHAGLFSSSEDLTTLFQMYLQYGYYGGTQYFDTATIQEFTRYQFDGNKNRRALGFDKPFKKYDPYGPVCKSASRQSFGHSGFTGTYVWVDPKHQLVYVFLSNRVYPRSDNYKISKFDIRTNIHQAIYDAMEK